MDRASGGVDGDGVNLRVSWGRGGSGVTRVVDSSQVVTFTGPVSTFTVTHSSCHHLPPDTRVSKGPSPTEDSRSGEDGYMVVDSVDPTRAW